MTHGLAINGLDVGSEPRWLGDHGSDEPDKGYVGQTTLHGAHPEVDCTHAMYNGHVSLNRHHHYGEDTRELVQCIDTC